MFAFEELKEKFLNIPEDIQEAISSNEVNEKLLALADKYELQFDEAEELTKEIGYIMLGLRQKKDFVKNIQKASGLNFEKSKEMAEEINNTIFADIRESLRKIHEPEEELDEDLDENLVREELLNEISNPTEKTTDLIKLPKKELIVSESSLDRVATAPSFAKATGDRHEDEKQNFSSTDFASQNPLRKSNIFVSANEVKQSSDNSEITNNNSEVKNNNEQNSQSTDLNKQNKPKSYTIDPYREPLD